MKIIDLLNKIANGEELPKKIKLSNGRIFKLDEDNAYYCYDIDYSSNWLSNEYIFGYKDLNEEIEILEEEKKIPEKLNIELNSDDENKVNYYRATNLECDLAFKINEIIDYLKSKGE